MQNMWQKLKEKANLEHRPLFVLAPMADVTDAAFRKIIAKYGKPDVFWTEFVSADGLVRANGIGKKKLLKHLLFSKKEKPIIAQFFTSNLEHMKAAAELAHKLGFDGIDINMGCPDRSVIRQGAGAALINNPKLACEIIRAAKESAPKLPISVKTRIGYNVIEYKKWLPKILKEGISALTIHLRTKKEMSDVPAHFELAKDIVKTVRAHDKKVILIANGDIQSLEQGKKLAKDTGFDGIMIGRGVFGNPWLFDSKVKPEEISVENKLKALLEHISIYNKLLDYRNFANMKKHFKAYVNGFEGAKELRIKLMGVESLLGAQTIIKSYLKNLK